MSNDSTISTYLIVCRLINAILHSLFLTTQIDDSTSQQICLACFQELQVAYEFRSRCLQANQYFETHRSRGHAFSDDILISSIEQEVDIKAEYDSSNDGDASYNVGVDNGISPIDDDAYFGPEASTSDNKRMAEVNVTSGATETKKKRTRSNKQPSNEEEMPSVSKQPKAKRRHKTTKSSVEVSKDGESQLCSKCGLSFSSNSDFIKHSKTHVKGEFIFLLNYKILPKIPICLCWLTSRGRKIQIHLRVLSKRTTNKTTIPATSKHSYARREIYM